MAKYNHFIITGGAGFIGSHLARAVASKGATVDVVDNLSRPGTRQNLELLLRDYPSIRFRNEDIRDGAALVRVLSEAPRGKSALFHQASQVAVTTSIAKPRLDFEVNALGTFNVLEAVREVDRSIPVVYPSTNKVYGGMEEVGIAFDPSAEWYAYKDGRAGIDESQPLDFHSPYGCSKGAADQYCRDFHRIYKMPTVVFRQSCIFGTHQLGIEDQGWVAWFAIASLLDRRITVYGDGYQVRDVLWIDDLVALYERAVERIETAAGQVYNVGGGPNQRLTLRRLLVLLEKLGHHHPHVGYADWRPGDQRAYYSNISKARRELDWDPKTGPEEGVRRLHAWVAAHRGLLEEVLEKLAPHRAVEQARREAAGG
ncbi:MAG: GDP-mannose 4,6-dehydratase [Candidatus Sumerlaeia bacterium]|nr:GDP-mannose 4,6-dehydratase [Candidatus Sumerlaeia bacterium]